MSSGASASRPPVAAKRLENGATLTSSLRLMEALPHAPHLWQVQEVSRQTTYLGDLSGFEPDRAAPSPRPRPDWLPCLSFYHPGSPSLYRIEDLNEGPIALWSLSTGWSVPPVNPCDLASADPTALLSALASIADAIAAWHELTHRAHGGLEQGKLAGSLEVGFTLPPPPWAVFLHDERETASAQARDALALAGLALEVLTGSTIDAWRERPNSVNTIRDQRGWTRVPAPDGWDAALRETLLRPATARRTTARELANSLRRVHRPLAHARMTDLTGPGSAQATRLVVPPWRQKPPGTARTVPSESSDHVDSPLTLLQQLRAREQQLKQHEDELNAREERLGAEKNALRVEAEHLGRIENELTMRASALERTDQELRTRSSALQDEMARLVRDRTASEEANRQLTALEAKLNAQQVALAEQARAHQEDVEELARRRTEIESKTKTADEELRAVRLQEQALVPQKEAFARREQRILELTQALHRLTGRTTESEWLAWLEEITRKQQDLQEKTEALTAEHLRLTEERKQLEEQTRTAVSPSPAKPGPETLAPPPPARTETPAPTISPPALPPSPERVTLLWNGRRIHVFAGSAVRLGRHGQSDVLLVALSNGQIAGAMAINREISRKHFELVLDAKSLRVFDGWTDDGTPSQHGICVDGRRVPTEGAILRSGNLLSLTTRIPNRMIPHWRVNVVTRTGGGSLTEEPAPSAATLIRLDESPEDIAIVRSALPIHALQNTGSVGRSQAIVNVKGVLRWQTEATVEDLPEGLIPGTTIQVLSRGFCLPAVNLS